MSPRVEAALVASYRAACGGGPWSEDKWETRRAAIAALSESERGAFEGAVCHMDMINAGRHPAKFMREDIRALFDREGLWYPGKVKS